MSPLLRACAAATVVAGELWWAPAVALADAPYDDAMTRAQLLEAGGDLDGAVATLEPLLAAFPDDYYLSLRLGWLHFQRGDYERAEAHYRRALELSHGGAEPLLGIGWVCLRTGRPAEALEAFDGVLAARPGDPSATEGRALAAAAVPPVVLSLDANASLLLYPGHPLKRWGFSVAPSIDASIAQRLLLGATYRYVLNALTSETSGSAGMMGPGGHTGQWAYERQNELYLRVGATWPVFGVMAHFAWVQDDTSLSGETWVGGLTFRVSALGELFGEASASSVDGAEIVRGALSWALPATDWLTLEPGFSIQRSAGAEILPDGSLVLLAHSGPFTAWVGGRYGRQERPVYLRISVVYNTVDRMLGGMYLGFRHESAGHVRTYIVYEWQALETPVGTDFVRSNAHFITFGVGGTP